MFHTLNNLLLFYPKINLFFRCLQEIHLDKHIKLLDCPGIVMATSTSDAAMILRNCVKIEQLVDPVPPVEAILRRCNKAQVATHISGSLIEWGITVLHTMEISCLKSFLHRLWIIMEFQTSRRHMSSWPYLPVVKASWGKEDCLTLTKLPKVFLWIGQGEVIVLLTLTSVTYWSLKNKIFHVVPNPGDFLSQSKNEWYFSPVLAHTKGCRFSTSWFHG